MRCCAILFLTVILAACAQNKPAPKKEANFAYLLKVEGPITPASLEQLEDGIDRAEKDGARALIFQLDTPGGLMTSMDSMIRRILSSNVPVLTYIGPPGAACGSAGVYILYASHVAAMAPGTNIGSATPVMIGGSGNEPAKPSTDEIPKEAGADDQVNLKRKLFHHAIAQIRSLAEYHGRNAEFAQRTITEAANVTSTEALGLGAIEYVVSSPEDLLKKANGRSIRMLTGTQVLQLDGLEIRTIQTGFRAEFLSLLANPALASILMMIGILGILGEVQYPGSIFPGVIGGICLILGLYALQTLPVNYAGVGLIILGIIMMILEVKVLSHGMLAISGVVSFALGGVLLVRSGGVVEKTTIALIAGSGLTIGWIIAGLMYLAQKSQRSAVVSGGEQLLRETGVTETEVSPSGGRVRLHSELWSAKTENGTLTPGTRVSITNRNGMLLTVRAIE